MTDSLDPAPLFFSISRLGKLPLIGKFLLFYSSGICNSGLLRILPQFISVSSVVGFKIEFIIEDG